MKLFDWPVTPNTRISQYFGENPAAYAKFNLRGHNGIDFAVPVGTDIFVCDAGTVKEVGNDVNGYGNYVKVLHWWGESLYAHLSYISVKIDDTLNQGQPIGLSGNTGNSTGPHLHFGIRILPYSRADGWNGHSDPYPYLTDKDNTYIIGAHIINGAGKHIEELKRLQPSIVLMLDPNKEDVQELKRVCPNTKIIGRIYREDSYVASLIRNSPTVAAKEMHNAVINHPAFGLVDYWQSWVNEVCQVDWTEFNNLVKCELERMKLATTYKCAIFAFSVGNPDMPKDNRMAYWRATYPALDYAEKNDHIVCLHEYGCDPNIWGPTSRGGPDWLIHRLEHQVFLELPFKKLKFAITEFGHDFLIVSGPASQGGYKARPSYANDHSLYAQHLIDIGKYLTKYKGRILGYAVFTLGHNSPWETYDIAGTVLNQLANDASKTDTNLAERLTEFVNSKQVIRINPDAALTKAALSLGLTTQVSEELEITINDKTYVAAKFENIRTGESSIIYTEKGQWQKVQELKLK